MLHIILLYDYKNDEITIIMHILIRQAQPVMKNKGNETSQQSIQDAYDTNQLRKSQQGKSKNRIPNEAEMSTE